MIMQRNAKFYFVSRYLRIREAVQYFGSADSSLDAVSESGPFFMEMKLGMNMQSFTLSLNGPTSTLTTNWVIEAHICNTVIVVYGAL